MRKILIHSIFVFIFSSCVNLDKQNPQAAESISTNSIKIEKSFYDFYSKMDSYSLPINLKQGIMISEKIFDEELIKKYSNSEYLVSGVLFQTDSIIGILIPIIITDYSDKWPDLYGLEMKTITDSFSNNEIIKIDHIGSTAIPGLKAKPTIDILLQVSEQIDISKLKDKFKTLGYLINDHPENPAPHLTFVKGYTEQGFKGQAYHVHIRYVGDWDEIRFRDYLIKNKEIAKEYEILKIELADKYRDDREKYTDLKTEWIEKINILTRKQSTTAQQCV